MANIDEAIVYLNMIATTTVQTIGYKKRNIKAQGQENWWITIILTILASRENLHLY